MSASSPSIHHTHTIHMITWPDGEGKPLRAFAIVPPSRAVLTRAVTLTADGMLHALDARSNAWRVALDLNKAQNVGLLGALYHDEQPYRLRLELSESGRFCAVVQALGQHGLVIDLLESRVTMPLDRGDYHEDHCQFAAAFATHQQREVIVHASDWNRMEVSDALTGRLLTERDTPRHDEEEGHYLDYFYCTLCVSQDQRWLANAGWVWHPVGCTVAWNLADWLERNVWESEDGPSRQSPAEFVSDDWDRPMTFLGDARLVVWGLWDDAREMSDQEGVVQGLTLYDVSRDVLLARRAFELPDCVQLGWTGELIACVHASGAVSLFEPEGLTCVGHAPDAAVTQHLEGMCFVRGTCEDQEAAIVRLEPALSP